MIESSRPPPPLWGGLRANLRAAKIKDPSHVLRAMPIFRFSEKSNFISSIFNAKVVPMAQWARPRSTEPEIPGSSPGGIILKVGFKGRHKASPKENLKENLRESLRENLRESPKETLRQTLSLYVSRNICEVSPVGFPLG